jgi:hypothetical protein
MLDACFLDSSKNYGDDSQSGDDFIPESFTDCFLILQYNKAVLSNRTFFPMNERVKHFSLFFPLSFPDTTTHILSDEQSGMLG